MILRKMPNNTFIKKQASILIITVWVLSVLSIFAIGLSYAARMQMRYAAHLQDRVKLYYLARAGIEKAIVELENKEDTAYMAFDQPILNDDELFKDIPLGDGFITLRYHITEDASKRQTTLYGVMDESAKIDINSVPADILSSMLERIAGLEQEASIALAQAIVDWRSLNQDPAVEEYYEELDVPYENKGAEFEIIEELLLVRGMTEPIFSEIRDIITVYNTEKVNINTAGFDTFYALGFSKRLSERIMEYRRGRDGVSGTDDDKIFLTVNNLRDIGFLFTEDSVQINTLISGNIIKVNSDTFRIHSFGHIKQEEDPPSRDITCVIRLREQQKPEILYWHEN
jgi:type II secretory pathway component PulK